jgi:hypothetical protein
VENSKQMSIFNDKPVDKDVDKSRIISKKPKTLRIKTEEGIIESNLAEMPFIYYYQKKEPINVLEYMWVDSKGVKRGLEVRNPKHGVPSSFEFDVLLALHKIFAKNNPVLTMDESTQQYEMLFSHLLCTVLLIDLIILHYVYYKL